MSKRAIDDLLASLTSNPSRVHDSGAGCWCQPLVQKFCPHCIEDTPDDIEELLRKGCTTCGDEGVMPVTQHELEDYDGSYELIITHHADTYRLNHPMYPDEGPEAL